MKNFQMDSRCPTNIEGNQNDLESNVEKNMKTVEEASVKKTKERNWIEDFGIRVDEDEKLSIRFKVNKDCKNYISLQIMKMKKETKEEN